MAKQKLDLFKFSARCMAQAGTRPTKVTRLTLRKGSPFIGHWRTDIPAFAQKIF
jgi:hypothetical protein